VLSYPDFTENVNIRPEFSFVAKFRHFVKEERGAVMSPKDLKIYINGTKSPYFKE
jgi:hypothetical protein